jgi:hypothetical protein
MMLCHDDDALRRKPTTSTGDGRMSVRAGRCHVGRVGRGGQSRPALLATAVRRAWRVTTFTAVRVRRTLRAQQVTAASHRTWKLAPPLRLRSPYVAPQQTRKIGDHVAHLAMWWGPTAQPNTQQGRTGWQKEIERTLRGNASITFSCGVSDASPIINRIRLVPTIAGRKSLQWLRPGSPIRPRRAAAGTD